MVHVLVVWFLIVQMLILHLLLHGILILLHILWHILIWLLLGNVHILLRPGVLGIETLLCVFVDVLVDALLGVEHVLGNLVD